MRRHLLVFGLVILSTLASAAEPLSRRGFMERVAHAFRHEVPGATVMVIGETDIEVRGSDRIARTFSLDDAYRSYQRGPERLDEIMARFVHPVAARIREQIAGIARLDPDRVVPVVRDQQWLAENIAALRARSLTPSYVTEDPGSDLVIIYAEDLPERTRFLVADVDVVAREGLRARALDNLLRLIPKARLQRHGDLYVSIAAGGDYEASLLLLDRFWSTGKIDGEVAVDGEIVVAAPRRGPLYATGSRNRAGIAALRDLVVNQAQGPNAVSRLLLVYRNGRFEKFEPRD